MHLQLLAVEHQEFAIGFGLKVLLQDGCDHGVDVSSHVLE